MVNSSECSKLSTCCFGVGLGVAKGLFVLFFAWAGLFFGFGTAMTDQIASVYYGYSPTILGGFIGALWGFVVGFVFGYIAAWFYNRCLDYCRK